jgi:hypothetical protein
MIKPEFWKDEKTGSLSDRGKLLFIGMLNIADDCGILRYNAPILRSEIFVYCDITKTEIEELMEEIEKAELIQVYQGKDEEQKYCIIKNFLKHQQIAKPTKSKLLKPDNFENILREIVEYSAYAEKLLQEEYGSTTVGVEEEYGSSTAQRKLKEEKGSVKGKETEPKGTENDKTDISFGDIVDNSKTAKTTTDFGEGERQGTANDLTAKTANDLHLRENQKATAAASPLARPEVIRSTSVETFKARVEYAKSLGIEESVARRICNLAQSEKFALCEMHYKGFAGKRGKEVKEAFNLLKFLAKSGKNPSGLKHINSS